ncbi:hypothetical protein Tco_0986915 [Tanacetum coccineum]
MPEPFFNADSDLLESLLNRDSPMILTKTISIFDDFSFSSTSKNINLKMFIQFIESLSYSPIPIEDSDSFIEEVDLFLTSDDSMPPGIESDDYDSEGDFRFLEELLINDSLPLPENESYNLNSVDNPESPVVKSENVDSLNVEEEDSFTFTIRSFLPFVTYPEVLPVSYSTGSEDKVFNPGIFDNDAFKDKSSKELAPSKALLTLDVFDPLHPPLMDFHERIEKTKRSKNRQETGKRQRDKRKSEESARDHSRISPTQSKKETMKSKTQDKVKRAKNDKFSKFEGLL